MKEACGLDLKRDSSMNNLTATLPVPTVTLPHSANSPSRPKKILIVDDDPIILKTMSLKLSGQGYKVATALDASSAIAAARDERPDLIMLDISFPPDISNGGRVAWDGFQIMSWLRCLEETKSTPFIILTGADTADCRQRSQESRAVALFHKPIDHRDLLQVVKRALEQKEAGKPQVFIESAPTKEGQSKNGQTLCSATQIVEQPRETERRAAFKLRMRDAETPKPEPKKQHF